jgi:hypothetical protein
LEAAHELNISDPMAGFVDLEENLLVFLVLVEQAIRRRLIPAPGGKTEGITTPTSKFLEIPYRASRLMRVLSPSRMMFSRGASSSIKLFAMSTMNLRSVFRAGTKEGSPIEGKPKIWITGLWFWV